MIKFIQSSRNNSSWNSIIEKVIILVLCGGSYSTIHVSIKNFVRCGNQCFLFGRIHEVKRYVEPGSSLSCLLSTVVGILSLTVCCSLLFRSRLSLSLKWYRILNVLGISVVSLSYLITYIGFKSWCSTFIVTRCGNKHVNMVIDWKMYEPKYTNGYKSSFYFTFIMYCNIITIFLHLLLLGMSYQSSFHNSDLNAVSKTNAGSSVI